MLDFSLTVTGWIKVPFFYIAPFGHNKRFYPWNLHEIFKFDW